MKKTIHIIVMAMLCLNFSMKGQEPIKPPPLKNQAIVGKVISTLTGETLPGAVIKITNTNQSIPANNNGEFILTLSNGSYNLSISSIGYKTKTIIIEIPTKKRLVIALENDDQNLKEVEIINTGYQNIPKERATGSFVTIDSALFNRKVGTTVLERLDGVTSGIYFNGLKLSRALLPSTSGNLGINVRGESTLSDNVSKDPLVILDNFPY